MSTLTNALAMSKPGDGDTSWGAEIRNAMDTLDWIHQPDRIYFVNKAFTTANLFPNGVPSDRRHFDTIQGAIDAIEATSPGGGLRNTICITPEVYNESLSITRSIAFCAWPGHTVQTHRGGIGVSIVGQGTNPCVTFTPVAGDYFGIYFRGIRFHHAHTTAGATQTWPMFLKVVDQGNGNYGAFENKITWEECSLRVDTAPDMFDYGMLIQGFNRTMFNRCLFRWPDAAGARFTKPIAIEGNTTTGVYGQLYMKRCETNHWGNSDQTIYLDKNTNGMYHRNTDVRARADIVTFGPSGSNSCSGLDNDTQFSQWGNLSGIAASMV